DEYGRKEKPYEDSKAMMPMTEDCIKLNNPEKGKQFKYSIQKSVLIMERIDDLSILRQRPTEEIIVVLEGGLVSREGEFILGPGDVVDITTVNRLVETFTVPHGISLLTIQRRK
ncbi:hypothetical protein KA005_62905, partial [bacterium]|nr:hypothetical protein [bacterium]